MNETKAHPPLPAYAKAPRGMPPSNQPDVAIAQDWFHDLDAWIDTHGLTGHDPFDIKQHPWMRAVQPYRLPRRASTLLCDLFPNVLRRLLHVPRTENPKSHALLALARLRMHELTHDGSYLDQATGHLEWLLAHGCPDYSGLCWGYPFHVYAKGLDTPAGAPVVVVSSIAGEAMLRAHAVTGEARWLDAARSISAFILEDLPRLRHTDGSFCFGYAVCDHRRVHNANLLAAQCLFRTAAATGDITLLDPAEAALKFSLARQREDGAWPYGEFSQGEPYEEANLRIVDHHHTGFMLRSLLAIQEIRPGEDIEKAVKQGLHFYLNSLWGPYGMPVNDYGRYPVDIHACAEAVLCTSTFAATRKSLLQQATMALRWAYWYLRDPRSGAPYYRRYRHYTSRLVCARWGVAWMYRALAEYLHAMQDAGGDLPPVSGKAW